MRIDQILFKNIYHGITTVHGQPVGRCLALLSDSQWWSRHEIRAAQEEKLQRLIETAGRYVPEYSDRLGQPLGRPLSLGEIQKIPLLDKQALRVAGNRLRHPHRSWLCTEKTTGGSTGEPVTITKSRFALAWELAATWRGYGWAGVHVGDRQSRFWGVPITELARIRARLIDFVCHRRRLSAFDLHTESYAQFDRKLRHWQPDYLYGYVSMIAALARWYLSNSQKPTFDLRAVITTSEVLSADDRAAIAAAFECPVYNEYGCGELGTIAHECEKGSLHTSDENMFIEVVDKQRVCGPDEKGEIVVTELNNVAMPLIRYRTGDYGSISQDPCACGRGLGVLSNVYGRAYDFIVSPDGRQYHAEFLVYIFEEAQRQDMGISQFRVRQVSPDHLEVSIVPAPMGFSDAAEQRLVARIRSLLGDMRVAVNRVSSIPREQSGKMRVIVGMQDATTMGAADTRVQMQSRG